MKFVFDPRPRTLVKVEPWGLQTMFRYALEDPTEAVFWVRPWVAPFISYFAMDLPDGSTGGLMTAYIPSTDEAHLSFSVVWSNEAPLTEEIIRDFNAVKHFPNAPKRKDHYHPAWTEAGYIQDRQAMRASKSYSGLVGIAAQDAGVQTGMGRIVDRTREHLATEDYMVIKARRYLLDAIRAHQDTGFAPGVEGPMDHGEIDYRWVVAPADTPLEEILNRPDWTSSGELVPEGTSPPEPPWAALPT